MQQHHSAIKLAEINVTIIEIHGSVWKPQLILCVAAIEIFSIHSAISDVMDANDETR